VAVAVGFKTSRDFREVCVREQAFPGAEVEFLLVIARWELDR
jgi:hypothetical protein